MIKSLGMTLALVCAGAWACPAADGSKPPALAWHFVGLKTLRESNPETTLNEIGALAKSGHLADQLRSRLTESLPGWFDLSSQHLSAELIGPLLADVLERESALHVAGEKLSAGNWVMAVQLDPAAIERWKVALFTIGRRLGLGEPEPLKAAGATGWRIPSKASLRGYAFILQKDWALVGSGFDAGSVAELWATGLAREGRPLRRASEEWLQLEVHPSAVDWNPGLPFAGRVSHINAAFSWRGKDVRTTAKLWLAENIKVSTADWQIPKGIALDPLVSFTAVRNLRKFFGELDPVKGLEAGSIPDQWYGWSRGSVAFIDDFAIPVGPGGQVYAHLERSVPGAYNPRLTELALGQWQTATNNARLLWRGLPVFVPYIGPKKDGDRDFLYGGIFPLTEQTNATPAPAELFAQFEGRKDLVYYDWEVTPARLAAYEQASPFVSLFLPAAKARQDTHGAAWLKEIQPKLGNVVTEITSASPGELTVTRRSQIGATGIELWLLTRWLDSEEFPKFPYRPPQRPSPGKRPAGSPGAGVPGRP